MRTFSFFIHDKRYTAPTLRLVLTSDEEHARELAQRELTGSEHHYCVEVDEDGRPLFRAYA